MKVLGRELALDSRKAANNPNPDVACILCIMFDSSTVLCCNQMICFIGSISSDPQELAIDMLYMYGTRASRAHVEPTVGGQPVKFQIERAFNSPRGQGLRYYVIYPHNLSPQTRVL